MYNITITQRLAAMLLMSQAVDYVKKCACGACYSAKIDKCPNCEKIDCICVIEGDKWEKEALERWNKK